MVLAQRQSYRSVEQDRKARNKPTYGHLVYDKGGKSIQWKTVLGKLENYKLKNEIKITFNTIHNYLKWIKDLNERPDTIKLF